MLETYIIKTKFLLSDVDKLYETMKIAVLDENIKELECQLEAGAWGDTSLYKEYNQAKAKKDKWQTIFNQAHELKDYFDLITEEKGLLSSADLSHLLSSAIAQYKEIKKDVDNLLLVSTFSEKYDFNNAILSIHAGAGGKEAQDWASMLMRMYIKWADANNYKCRLLDLLEGEFHGSVKSCTMEISGAYAFGMLKNEAGVHRLIRVSPFDSQNRRHTSFSAIEIIPEIDINTSVELDMKDIKIDTFRSSGAGGQHVNKTESAVRLTHLPTGIVVECQQERSQHQNKDYAMKVLLSKLVAIKEQEHYDEISQIQGEQRGIEWGSQIRTYTFMPYQLVKDHRTNYETGNINAVMDGDINDFIYKCLVS